MSRSLGTYLLCVCRFLLKKRFPPSSGQSWTDGLYSKADLCQTGLPIRLSEVTPSVVLAGARSLVCVDGLNAEDRFVRVTNIRVQLLHFSYRFVTIQACLEPSDKRTKQQTPCSPCSLIYQSYWFVAIFYSSFFFFLFFLSSATER